MSTTTPAATRPVEISDTTLLSFHNQREIAYRGTKKQIDESEPSLKAATETIVTFKTQVRERGKALQEERIKVPSQEELASEKQAFLSQYQSYKATYEKSGLLADNILGTIGFLTPVQRTYAQETSFKTDSPELYAQTKRSEEVCLGYIVELRESHGKVTALRGRLLESINLKELTWSLQRFCGIVDNHGKPLAWTSRAANYVAPYLYTPTIEKPKGKSPETSPSTVAASVSTEAVPPLQLEEDDKGKGTGSSLSSEPVGIPVPLSNPTGENVTGSSSLRTPEEVGASPRPVKSDEPGEPGQIVAAVSTFLPGSLVEFPALPVKTVATPLPTTPPSTEDRSSSVRTDQREGTKLQTVADPVEKMSQGQRKRLRKKVRALAAANGQHEGSDD